MLLLRDAFHVPGLISMTRFPLALVFPFVWSRPALAATVLVAAGVSDVLDGFWARRFHQTTPMGAVLDPIMDKLFVLVVATTLIAVHAVSPVEAILLATREIVEVPLVLYVIATHVTREHGANWAGKMTTALQFLAVGFVLVHAPHRAVAIGATAVAGVVAGATYWARVLGAAKRRRAAHRAAS